MYLPTFNNGIMRVNCFSYFCIVNKFLVHNLAALFIHYIMKSIYCLVLIACY